MLAETSLNFQLKITIDKVENEDNKKKQTEIVMQLLNKKTENECLAKRVITWPIGQELPNSVSYDKATEVVVIKSATSQAEVPLKSSKIASITASCINASFSNVRTYAAFAVNPVETVDTSGIPTAVVNAINSPLKEKRWNKLITSLEGFQNGESSGILTGFQQSQLYDAVSKYSEDADSDPEVVSNVLTSIVNSRILTFRNEDLLLRLCIKREMPKIVELVLNDHTRVLSEGIIAELLKIAANKKSEKKMRKSLREILNRSFSRKPMTEAAAEVLTATESVEIMSVLTEIYKDFDENDISTKALSMITILMDAHGSRIIYEDGLHPKFAIISNFMIEMESLTGTFSRLENALTVVSEEDVPKFGVRRVQLVRHPLVWK